MMILYNILSILVLIYGLYFTVTGLFALKNMRKPLIGTHKPQHKFAVIIAARNEETVIGDIIKSLDNQNYPKELYEVFIIPNNCSDRTEEIAEAAGATVLKCTVPVSSKGDVLKFAFSRLSSQRDIDAFLIFDADNIVHPEFLPRMNDALCEGYRVAQGFRDSKNYGDNWLSGSYSLFYWLQNFFFNKARMQIKGSASINGTGFMIKRDVFDEFGFNTMTLTEDIEFSAQ